MTYYQQNVLAAIKTDTDNLTLAGTTNATVQTTGGNKSATSTRPVSGSGSFVFNAEGLSYMKIYPFFQNTGANTVTSPTLRVIGWNLNVASGLYIPMLICDVAITLTTSDATINSASLRQALAITKTYGDAKVYSSASSPACGVAMLVDTLGCQLIELAFRAASVGGTPVANALYMSI
jgi:hypothetical protein